LIQEEKPSKNSLKETIIVFGIMTAMLLPARMLFVNFVSDSWLGSFGVISGIALCVIILAKKQRLGKFGEMFERQMYKIQSGNKAKIIYGQVLIVILILSVMIFVIQQGNETFFELKTDSEKMIVTQNIIDTAKNPETFLSLNNFVNFALLIQNGYPELSAMMATMNDNRDGWILHFYTVSLVECLEIFGVLLVYRMGSKNKILKH